ncbi:hypothetical protein [Kangiella koreensis]|uniref:Uncharacterized protein n=1 Tax=Kangiella koreensis (strain DSM 16069 / JCM 12317 / KCTC 12182 / SW-125) TaxID=523791 RepID=C7RAA2_KANKD|nr:hypothetical protein [Kangiella koreensis]ACV26221.1 hypothetical protein Kkor_0801 [Kangiella koreensis DSM 16069]
MSSWNRSYLEAMSVPVWVSRQEAIANIVTEPAEAEVATKADGQLEQETTLGFVSVVGDMQAKICILVTADQDLQQAKSNFLLLAQAWKQWQDTDLPLTLLQLVEQDHSTENAEPINDLKEKQLLLASSQSLELPHLTVKPAPTLNWQSASDKKAWWQLIQQLV